MDENIRKEVRNITARAYINNLHSWAEETRNYSQNIVDKALSILDDIFFNEYKGDFLVTLQTGSLFYRARVVPPEDYGSAKKGIHRDTNRLYGYNSKESAQPPAEKAIDARNSPSGVVALYLADDEITACTEVRPEIRQFVSLAKFRLTEDIVILDFSKKTGYTPLNLCDDKYEVDVRYLLSHILYLFTEPAYSYDEKKYKLTQKLTEHFRKKGYKGFKYNSFYTTGKNFTFFDEYMDKFCWLDSRLTLNYAVANLFATVDMDGLQCDFSSNGNIVQGISSDARGGIWNDMKKVIKYQP